MSKLPKDTTEDEWRQRLSPEEFGVLRQHGTERPGSSPLNKEKRTGIFRCAGCGSSLFRSDTKFESGTGWPSFTAPFDQTGAPSQSPADDQPDSC